MDRKDKRENWWIIYFFAATFVLFVGFWWFNAINVTPEIKIENPKAPNPNAFDYYLSAADLMKDNSKVEYAINKKPKGWKYAAFLPNDRYYSTSEKVALLNENAPVLKNLEMVLSMNILTLLHGNPVRIRTLHTIRSLEILDVCFV